MRVNSLTAVYLMLNRTWLNENVATRIRLVVDNSYKTNGGLQAVIDSVAPDMSVKSLPYM